MSVPVFRLRVPSEADYRVLATEVVTRYFDLIGGAEPDRKGLEAAFGQALAELAAPGAGGAPAADLEVACVTAPGGGELRLRCGTRTSVVSYRQPPGPQ